MNNTYHGGTETRRNAKTFAADFRRLTQMSNTISLVRPVFGICAHLRRSAAALFFLRATVLGVN
jgi:hypothetical protein